MPTIEVSVRRVSVVSSRPFDEMALRPVPGQPRLDRYSWASCLPLLPYATGCSPQSESSIGPWYRLPRELGASRRRRTRGRYLRLIDPATRVWFHVFEENSVHSLERLSHGATLRGGLIVRRARAPRTVFENDTTSVQ